MRPPAVRLLGPVTDQKTFARHIRVDGVVGHANRILAVLGFDVKRFGNRTARVRAENARDSPEAGFVSAVAPA